MTPTAVRRLAVTLFLVGSLAGFAAAARADLTPRDDAAQYLTAASHLVRDGRYADDAGPTALREPGYPVFVAGIFALTGENRVAVLAAQALLLGVIAAGAFLLARRALPDAWAFAAGAAVIPCLASYAGLFLTELFAAALVLALLFALEAVAARPTARRAALAGLILGALVLTKAVVLLFVPFAAIILFVRHRAEPKRALLVAAFLIAAAALVAPWMLRNERLTGRAQVAARGGLVMWARANRTGFSEHDRRLLMAQALLGDRLTAKFAPDVIAKRQALEGSAAMQERYLALRADGLTDAETDAALAREAVAMVLRHPVRYGIDAVQQFFLLNMIAVPVVDMRAFLAAGHEGIPGPAKDAIVIALRLANFAWIFLLCYGVWASRKAPRLVWPMALIIFWNAAYMAIDAIPRYAVPILPLALLFAAVAARDLAGRLGVRIRAAAPLPPAGSRTRPGSSS